MDIRLSRRRWCSPALTMLRSASVSVSSKNGRVIVTAQVGATPTRHVIRWLALSLEQALARRLCHVLTR
jgi:hypothetical protein